MPHSKAIVLRHVMFLAGLLALSSVIQVLLVTRATLPAPDTVRFAAVAQSMQQEGLLATLARDGEQPLFPLWMGWVHTTGEKVFGASGVTWAGTAQFAAAVPLVLSLVPLYLLMLRLVGPKAAAVGGLLFCVLPEVARLGADGISDTTHLLFFCIALWAIVEYFSAAKGPRRGAVRMARPPLWLLAGGMATGVALLARAETLVLAASLGAALLLFQRTSGWRQTWASLAAASGCFLLGVAVVWGPLLAATDSTAPEAIAARVLGRPGAVPAVSTSPAPETAEIASGWLLDDGRSAAFDIKDRTTSTRRRGLATAIVRFLRELADATGYWVGALALFGAWRLGRWRAAPCDRLLQIFFALFSLATIATAANEGYLAPRHLLPLVVVSIGPAGCGALELAVVLARRLDRRAAGPLRTRWAECPAVGRRRWAGAIVLLAAAACSPQTLLQIHHSRLGHRMAAEWLGEVAPPGSAVLDTQGFTGLYGRRATYPYAEAPAVLGDPRLVYLVVEQRELTRDSRRGQTLRWLLSTAGRKAAEFPPRAARRANHRRVLVYRWYAERFDSQPGPAVRCLKRPVGHPAHEAAHSDSLFTRQEDAFACGNRFAHLSTVPPAR